MSLLIDLGLVLIFLITLFICYRRGLLRTGITAIKMIATLVATYMTQDMLRPILDRFLPENLTFNIEEAGSFLPGGLLDRYFQVLAGNFISSAIIFVGYFILFSLLAGLILELMDRFILTKLLDKIGGLAMGIILGAIVTFLAAYVTTVVLLTQDAVLAVKTIEGTLLLKLIVGDNLLFITTQLLHQ